MHTEINTIPARLISIVSLESEDSIKAGVARYITKSFTEERSIFFFFPNKYPIDAMRNTGSTTLIISLEMAMNLLSIVRKIFRVGYSFYQRI